MSTQQYLPFSALPSCLCSVSAYSQVGSPLLTFCYRVAGCSSVSGEAVIPAWLEDVWQSRCRRGRMRSAVLRNAAGPQMALTKGPTAITPAAAAWCGNKSGETINDEASRQHWLVKRIVGRRRPADLFRQHHQTQGKMQSFQGSCYHGGQNNPLIKGKNCIQFQIYTRIKDIRIRIKEFSCQIVFIFGSGDLVSPGNLFIRDTISEDVVWV